MARALQQVLSSEMKVRLTHGGELSKGKRKLGRPIATRRPMHIVMRSSLAVGGWSFLHPSHAPFIRCVVPLIAKRFNVQLYEWSQNSNHLHLLLRAATRDGLKHFLMAVSGRISQKITCAKKGNPLGKRFFDHIPFSRIVEWGRSLVIARRYIIQNNLEALGLVAYRPRKARLGHGPPSIPRATAIEKWASMGIEIDYFGYRPTLAWCSKSATLCLNSWWARILTVFSVISAKGILAVRDLWNGYEINCYTSM